MWCSAMYIFAGNTAINNAISPRPAIRLSHGIITPIPPATSAAPLTYTSMRGQGSQGGTIAT